MATGKLSRLVIGALAALAVAGAGPALAQHGGGGGGGFHGGGGGGFHGGGAVHGGGGFRGGGFHGGAPGYHGAGGYRGGYYGGWRGRGGYGWGGYGWGGYYGGAGWLGYGLLFSALPLAYATYYWDGVPYYYADDNYYQWDSAANEYETVAPPAGLVNQVAAAAPADAQQADGQADLFAYPKNGQSASQQAKDRSDCQQWATGQVGADATRHADYLRAEGACLTGKGYSVR
ncbi:MAG TPA: hypothetical protein VK727_21520 [Steroidobacteraceae bacterium]|jgi:hypothetical protein|nr:hypothetical protein [Steroidobacteraceae bacterium]